jgi:hypothetical protein
VATAGAPRGQAEEEAVEHHFETIALNWGINIAFGIVALAASLLMILLMDRLIFTRINFLDEIQKGNLAAAVAFAAMLGFTAYIIGAALR